MTDAPTPIHAPVPPRREEPSQVGEWARRRWLMLGLLTRNDYRRDALRLMVTQLRTVVGFRFGLAIVAMVAAGAYLTMNAETDAREGYQLLARLFAIASLLLAAPIYAADQRQGTFELLWLATGSEKALLRMKVTTLMIALGLFAVPAVWVASGFYAGQLPFLPTLFFLLTNGLLITALMAYVGTWLPQAWASLLVGAGILVPIFLLSEDWASPINIFNNPIDSPQAGVGRLCSILLSLYLLGQSARRLKRSFN